MISLTEISPKSCSCCIWKQNKKCFLIMVSSLQEMPKMILIVWSLSGVELLQFSTLNLCGFDPGLEARSRWAMKSNLVIYLVPYWVCLTGLRLKFFFLDVCELYNTFFMRRILDQLWFSRWKKCKVPVLKYFRNNIFARRLWQVQD